MLHSKDDPVVSVKCVPKGKCYANPNIITAITERGAHVCYFIGHQANKRWYTHAATEFLENALELLEDKER